MKKLYQTPEIEKIEFECSENICAGRFTDLFKLQFASTEDSFTREAVFDWSGLNQ